MIASFHLICFQNAFSCPSRRLRQDLHVGRVLLLLPDLRCRGEGPGHALLEHGLHSGQLPVVVLLQGAGHLAVGHVFRAALRGQLPGAEVAPEAQRLLAGRSPTRFLEARHAKLQGLGPFLCHGLLCGQDVAFLNLRKAR